MTTLHTFGCSITQGYALPDVVNPIIGDDGMPLDDEEIEQRGIEIDWNKIHLYQPSQYAWPQKLADQLGIKVINHARRGACFQQIARQCAVGVKDIKPDDIVIVMWTYLSRLSLQWPARTSVPFCNVVDPDWGWKTVLLGFNKLFGLESNGDNNKTEDEKIQTYIENSTKNTYLDPMGIYNRYYNNLILQQMTDGFLRSTGARVINLSVEREPVKQQLEQARKDLYSTLGKNYNIPHPDSWYKVLVDYESCLVLLDPRIPPAENDMHPSVTHHRNFAEHIRKKYF